MSGGRLLWDFAHVTQNNLTHHKATVLPSGLRHLGICPGWAPPRWCERFPCLVQRFWKIFNIPNGKDGQVPLKKSRSKVTAPKALVPKAIVPRGSQCCWCWHRIARVTDSVTTKDVLVVNLTPLPRYQGSCCVVSAHGLQGVETPGTLNTLLRDMASTWVGLVLCTGLTMMTLWYPQWTVLAPGLSLTHSPAGTTSIQMGSSYLLLPWPSYLSERCTNVISYLAPRVCCRPASPSRHSSEVNRGGGHLEVPSLTTNIRPLLSVPSISPLYLLSRAPSMNNRTFPRKVLLHQSYMFFGAYCFLLSLVNPLFFMESWPTWAPIEQSEPTTSPKQQNWLSPALLAVHLRHPQGIFQLRVWIHRKLGSSSAKFSSKFCLPSGLGRISKNLKRAIFMRLKQVWRTLLTLSLVFASYTVNLS